MATEFRDDGRAGRGMTLVELAIVSVAITVVLAFKIPVLREREHASLQALATASPGEVFELRCYREKVAVKDGDDFVILCELRNPTGFALDVMWTMTLFTPLDRKMDRALRCDGGEFRG